MTTKEKQKLLNQYWDAHAQFGPFEVTPEEFVRMNDDQFYSTGFVVCQSE